jgi:hypothetical protein
MRDPLDLFSDIKDWPGKRPPANRDSEDVGSSSDESWDAKPIKYMFGGQQREFYTISHLAAALNKSVVTIRSWEHKGLLPRTPFRSPRPRGDMLPGTKPVGKRLWTREQILGIIRIAHEEQVIVNGKAPTLSFSTKVLELYKQLLSTDTHKG